MNWWLTVMSKFTDISGRASRTEYWMFTLFSIFFLFEAGVLDIWFGLAREDLGFGVLTVLFLWAILLPAWAVTVRRLHDVGKSGWWILIILIPTIGGLWLLGLTVMDSQAGDNRYGANPKTNLEAMSTTTVGVPKSDLGTWLRWMGAGLSAWVVVGVVSGCAFLGEFAGFSAQTAMSDPSAPADAGLDWTVYVFYLGVALGLVVAGFAAGALQWLFLRRRIGLSDRWVLASGAGSLIAPIALVPFIVYLGLEPALSSTTTPDQLRLAFRLSLIFIVALAGLVLGTSQWLVLRRQVQQAGWWIPASAGAWALASGHLLIFQNSVLLGLLLVLLLPPAITGAVFAWLWRRPRAEPGAERPPGLAPAVTP